MLWNPKAVVGGIRKQIKSCGYKCKPISQCKSDGADNMGNVMQIYRGANSYIENRCEETRDMR